MIYNARRFLSILEKFIDRFYYQFINIDILKK